MLLVHPPVEKTALIFFLLRFAKAHFGGEVDAVPGDDAFDDALPADDNEHNEQLNNGAGSAAGNNQETITNPTQRIRRIRPQTFFRQIREETKVTKNIGSTEKNSIDMIELDTGRLTLRVYNISGEVFSDPDTNDSLIKQLSIHLQDAKKENTFALLCNESESKDANVSDISVMATFFEHSQTAKDIFTRIGQEINTIRVVTKFDLVHEITQKPIHNKFDNPAYYFELMQQSLYIFK